MRKQFYRGGGGGLSPKKILLTRREEVLGDYEQSFSPLREEHASEQARVEFACAWKRDERVLGAGWWFRDFRHRQFSCSVWGLSVSEEKVCSKTRLPMQALRISFDTMVFNSVRTFRLLTAF